MCAKSVIAAMRSEMGNSDPFKTDFFAVAFLDS
jgi:hypothetical protein